MKFSAMSYLMGKNKMFGSNFKIFKEKIAQFLCEYGPNNTSWLLLTKFTKFVAKKNYSTNFIRETFLVTVGSEPERSQLKGPFTSTRLSQGDCL